MMNDLITKLQNKDKEFVTFWKEIQVETAKKEDLLFFLSGLEEIEGYIADIQVELTKTTNMEEKKKLLEDLNKWTKERSDYYKEVERIKKQIEKNHNTSSELFDIPLEKQKKYAHLIQLVTIYDGMKTRFSKSDFTNIEETIKKINTLYRIQEDLNRSYQEILETNTILEEKDVLPRKQNENESEEAYQKYLEAYYKKEQIPEEEEEKTVIWQKEPEEQDEYELFDFWLDHYETFSNQNSYIKQIDLQNDTFRIFVDFISHLSPVRVDLLRNAALESEMNVLAHETYLAEHDTLMENQIQYVKELETKEATYTREELYQIMICSKLFQCFYLLEKEPKENTEKIEAIKEETNRLYKILMKTEKPLLPEMEEIPEELEEQEPDYKKQIEEAWNETLNQSYEFDTPSEYQVPSFLQGYIEKAQNQRKEQILKYQHDLEEAISQFEESKKGYENQIKNKMMANEEIPKELLIEYHEELKNIPYYKSELARIANMTEEELANQSFDLKIPPYQTIEEMKEYLKGEKTPPEIEKYPTLQVPSEPEKNPETEKEQQIAKLKEEVEELKQKLEKKEEKWHKKAFKVVRKASAELLSRLTPKKVVSATIGLLCLSLLTTGFTMPNKKTSNNPAIEIQIENPVFEDYGDINLEESNVVIEKEITLEDANVPHIGDEFRVKLGVSVYEDIYVGTGQDKAVGKPQFFSPDTLIPIQKIGFLDSETGIVHVSHTDEESLEFIKQGYQYISVGEGFTYGYYPKESITVEERGLSR